MTAKGPYGYARGHRALEIVCILGTFAEFAYLAWKLARGVSTPVELALTLVMLTLGYFLADFISGLVHWSGDTLGRETTPVFGKNFIEPFRVHHTDPKLITRHDFIETNGNNCVIIVMVVAPAVVWMPARPSLLFYAFAVWFSTAVWIFGTNQFHKWAHADNVGPFVAWLQRHRLVLNSDHHKIHHTAPYDTHYCITHGWLNPLIARTGFFRGLERVVGWVAPRFLFLEERARYLALHPRTPRARRTSASAP